MTKDLSKLIKTLLMLILFFCSYVNFLKNESVTAVLIMITMGGLYVTTYIVEYLIND